MTVLADPLTFGLFVNTDASNGNFGIGLVSGLVNQLDGRTVLTDLRWQRIGQNQHMAPSLLSLDQALQNAEMLEGMLVHFSHGEVSDAADYYDPTAGMILS